MDSERPNGLQDRGPLGLRAKDIMPRKKKQGDSKKEKEALPDFTFPPIVRPPGHAGLMHELSRMTIMQMARRPRRRLGL
jgi:hypothetical protein